MCHHKWFSIATPFLILFVATGCAVYKNPAPSIPGETATLGWHAHYPLHICVRTPQGADFNCIRDKNIRQFELQQSISEAQRLVKILNQCRLFDEVTMSDPESTSCDITIAALPRTCERTDYDSPWLLLYGGVLPIYSKNNKGVYFEFLDGSDEEFSFDWTEEMVIGLWAPVVRIAGTNWQFGHTSNLYWKQLRTALIQKFDDIQK